MSEPSKIGGEPLIRIVHPSDFSKASKFAFAHALKIALRYTAELEIIHVQDHQTGSAADVHWSDFPGVRTTLARWDILSLTARSEEVAKTGLRVKKILNAASDPLETMVRYCAEHPPDLLVLATH